MDIKTVKTDRFSMDYIRFGSGPRPFVILPGLSVQSVMLSADLVANAYAEMTDDFTVYLFDRRKEPPEPYDTRDMAEDTADALREAGLSGADIFGASQGGMMAMLIAAYHPELVRRLVVSSAATRVTKEEFRTMERWIAMAEEGDAEKLYMDFGKTLYPEDVFAASRAAFSEAAKQVTSEELHDFIIFAEGMRGFDIRDELVKITCPVFSLGDTDDLVFGGGSAEEIVGLLGNSKGSRSYIYKGYGHAVYDMAPDFKKRIMDFLFVDI